MSTLFFCRLRSSITFTNQIRNYAVKSAATGSLMGLGKGKKAKTAVVEKLEIPVETDPYKLVNYVCGSNIYKDGEDVKIKADSEYPDWLFEMRVGRAPRIHELDPTTKEYWLRVRRHAISEQNRRRTLKRY